MVQEGVRFWGGRGGLKGGGGEIGLLWVAG